LWFLLRQLEEEIEKMLAMDGLRRKDHVLELNRLMLRAESVEHRLSLLRIIQVNTVLIACYSFYHNQDSHAYWKVMGFNPLTAMKK